MEKLQFVLFICGAIIIIGVLVHGFWSIRRQSQDIDNDPNDISNLYKNQIFAEKYEETDPSINSKDTIFHENKSTNRKQFEPTINFKQSNSSILHPVDQNDINVNEDEINDYQLSLNLEPIPEVVPQVVVDKEPEVKPLFVTEQRVAPNVQQPTSHNIFKIEPQIGKNMTTEDKEISAPLVAIRDEKVASVQLTTHTKAPYIKPNINFDNNTFRFEGELPDPDDILVIHVVASRNNKLFSGPELLATVLALAFKHGYKNIFHRHRNQLGKGDILFSLANMVKPGDFILDKIETFTTPGVTLFMPLPCYGDPLMNFSTMLNAAKQIADDLNGIVLDDSRHPWSQETKDSYIRRIKKLIPSNSNL